MMKCGTPEKRRINNRLLCELATHKDFIKFLADIEIYVDGLPPCRFRTSMPLSIPSDMKSLNVSPRRR